MNLEEQSQFYLDIGKRIRDIRNSKNVSQEELADSVNLKRTSITNIEKGRQKLLIHSLWDIAKALNVNITSLLPIMEEPYKEALRDLPEAFQRAVEATLNKGGE